MAAAPAAPVKTPNDAEDKCPACAQHIDAASSSHRCVICQRAIHAWCGDAEGDEGYAQQRRCPDCQVSDKVEDAEPATPSTKKETKGKYVPKRKGFEIPDGFVKKNITEILKGKKISRLWEHFEVYAKESSHVCICRLCGAQVKNDVLRTGALQQHVDAKTDYGHNVMSRLVKETENEKSSTSITSYMNKPDSTIALVEWLTSSLVAPHVSKGTSSWSSARHSVPISRRCPGTRSTRSSGDRSR